MTNSKFKPPHPARTIATTASSDHPAPVILGVLHAIMIALLFWIGVGYLMLLLA